jgi:DNA-binding response OmpR family regulator
MRFRRVSGRTRTLVSHASRLRRKLDPDSGRFVINVWGVGYRLIDG